MRRLYLVNEVGTTYFLDYKSKTLIETIEGLGFDYDIEYQEFESSFVESKRTLPLRVINATLIFLEGYVGFTKWRDFITKSNNLRLFYEADGLKYCYINIKSSTKTQIESGVLRSTIEIECLTLWLVNKSKTITVSKSDEGKTYPYKYTYVYSVSFDGNVTVINESARSIPLKIRIIGNVFNPRVLVRQGGVVVSGMRLLLDERDSPIIEMSADPVNQYIKKIVNGEDIDIYSDQDFSYDNFLILPPGQSEIYFDPGVREVSTCEISFREEYIAH